MQFLKKLRYGITAMPRSLLPRETQPVAVARGNATKKLVRGNETKFLQSPAGMK